MYDEVESKSFKSITEEPVSSPTTQERSFPMIYTIVIVLLVLFVLGYFGTR